MPSPRNFRWRTGCAVVAGLLHAASLAWPFSWLLPFGQSFWWMQVAAITLFATELQPTRDFREAAALSLTFHITLFSSSLYWLHTAMNTYGGLPSVLSMGAVLALALALSAYGVIAACWYVSAKRRNPQLAPFLFAAMWLLAELARGQWLTGFGWGAAGYAHIDGPFAPAAPWIGAYGIGALTSLSAASMVHFAAHRRMTAALPIVGVAVFLGGAAMVPDPTSASGTLRAALLQGNIAQDEKFDSATGVQNALAWYSDRLQAATTDLVLAPETAIPVLPQQLPEGYLERISGGDGHASSSTKILGIPLGSYSEGYTNSVVALGTGYRYDKHHLVPFGEFIPPMFKWFVRMMDIPLGDFNRGDAVQPSLQVANERVSPSICFEDLFAEELALRFLDVPSSPTIFANFSNLAWFGDSTAMYQHQHISQMRSLEFGRPFLRVSNTGVTSVIDHHGQVIADMPAFSRGVLHAQVQGQEGLTVFAAWCSRYGQWPLWIIGLLVLLLGSLRWQRKASPPQ